jgi:CRISPR-associated protein Csx17
MPDAARPLRIVAISGLPPHSLGNYLASLGLLRVLSRSHRLGEQGTEIRWPHVRAAWRGGVFYIIDGPPSLDEVVNAIGKTAERLDWLPYTRGWTEEQKRGTKSNSATPLARWQSSADEAYLELFLAHVVPAGAVNFNPMLGSGGNAGRREFSKGWQTATAALAPSNKKRGGIPDAGGRLAELRALLAGEPISWRMELNAASWFSDSIERVNTGQRPFAKGIGSPWAMVLACEGLVFFAGGASRRLGSRARAVGAFPFIVQAAAPTASGGAGRDLGEVWAPIWSRPMTVAEVVALFSRGRAEIGGGGALTPSAFAVAIRRRGVDAGITEFRRFALGRTTSANTFEPRFEGIVIVPDRPVASGSASVTSVAATALERLLGLIDSLPRDRKEGTRWRYLGLRGPVEAAMLRATASSDDPETVCALLDAAVRALDRIDANKQFRNRNVTWQALPANWLSELARLGLNLPTEGRLALALVSSFPAARPFALYRFGAELRVGGPAFRLYHPETAPARWTWRAGPLPRALAGVIQRYVLDWEQGQKDGGSRPPPLRGAASAADLELWLARRIDEDLLGRWLSRFALFDWREFSPDMRQLSRSPQRANAPSAELCVYGILHPLFDLRPILRERDRTREDLMPPEGGARTPASARRIGGLLRSGDVGAAVEVARSRYRMAGALLATSEVPWQVGDPERLLASLLFPVSHLDRARLIDRWLRPRRHTMEGENA